MERALGFAFGLGTVAENVRLDYDFWNIIKCEPELLVLPTDFEPLLDGLAAAFSSPRLSSASAVFREAFFDLETAVRFLDDPGRVSSSGSSVVESSNVVAFVFRLVVALVVALAVVWIDS